MTFHRAMIAAALFLAAAAMKMYLPAESAVVLPAAQRLISAQEYALPREAIEWLDWR